MLYPFRVLSAVNTALLMAVLLGNQAIADTGPCAQANGGALPDLIVDAQALAAYISVSDEKFTASSCSVQEDFISTPGWSTLMRFTTSTPNVGEGALVIGNPSNCSGLFEISTCHGHAHFKEYTDYRLWTATGYDTWLAVRDMNSSTTSSANAAYLAEAASTKQLLSGRKMGFCMIDSVRYLNTAGATPVFTSCSSNQGLSAGWSDRYDARLDGQYVSVDNLKAGIYVLEVHVNPEHLLPETNYVNNSSAVRIRYVPKRGTTPATVEVLP